MRTAAIAAALAVSIPASVQAAKPRIQWDTEYDNASVSTFRWIEPSANSLAEHDPGLHAHVANAIQFHLTSRGFNEVEADADIHVSYHYAADGSVRLEPGSSGYSFGRYGMGGWGFYGYGISGPVYSATSGVDLAPGELMVDIWDVSEAELVWRGTVTDIVISDDLDKTRRNIEKAIERMVKQYDKARASVE